MLKKFFNVFIMTVVLIVVSNNQAFAYRAAVILDTPSGMFSDPEKVYKTLQTSFDNIFGAGSDIMPLGETDSYVQIYREEHDLIYTADIDDSTQTSNRDLILKKEDIKATCKHFGTPYVIYVRITSTAPRTSVGFFTASQKINVTLDFRIWSDSEGDFTYAKRTSATGASTTVYAGGNGSTSHAIERGLKKNLQQIEKEASTITSAMK